MTTVQDTPVWGRECALSAEDAELPGVLPLDITNAPTLAEFLAARAACIEAVRFYVAADRDGTRLRVGEYLAGAA